MHIVILHALLPSTAFRKSANYFDAKSPMICVKMKCDNLHGIVGPTNYIGVYLQVVKIISKCKIGLPHIIADIQSLKELVASSYTLLVH